MVKVMILQEAQCNLPVTETEAKEKVSRSGALLPPNTQLSLQLQLQH